MSFPWRYQLLYTFTKKKNARNSIGNASGKLLHLFYVVLYLWQFTFIFLPFQLCNNFMKVEYFMYIRVCSCSTQKSCYLRKYALKCVLKLNNARTCKCEYFHIIHSEDIYSIGYFFIFFNYTCKHERQINCLEKSSRIITHNLYRKMSWKTKTWYNKFINFL